VTQQVERLKDRLEAVLALSPETAVIEYRGGSMCWGALAEGARRIGQALADAGVEPGAPVGWMARNRPAAVAGFVALVTGGHPVIPLRPGLSPDAQANELRTQKLQAVIADPEDWIAPEAIQAARDVGTAGIAVSGIAAVDVAIVPDLARKGAGPFRAAMPGIVMERLTSGTTGAPKRIAVGEDMLIPSLRAAEEGSKGGEVAARITLKTSPTMLFKPFGHAGGLFALLLALYQARPIILFEKFAVEDWADAVARFKPKTANLVPAMIQMILEAEVAPEKLSSLIAVRSSTAPLDRAAQKLFEERYGIPVLIDYGAAEFIGGVAGWSLKDYQAFGESKAGSVGRPRRDVSLRVVDAETGNEVPAGETGLLEIASPRWGEGWFRTTDLAAVDADGFLFLRGRADDAINRGGFKVLPEDVAAVLRRFPGVRDAAVVGKPDARLGQVPIAAVELLPGTAEPEQKALADFVRQHMVAYMVPVEFRFVEELPRTASLKVARPELKKMLGLA
jgi:acyl-CoA synthetase (AMP-forming)/AMP-acid ligase II